MSGSISLATTIGTILLAMTIQPSEARADEVRPVRYGVVEARRPVEIKGGLLGLRAKPGMTYTIRLTQSPASIEVRSPNLAFLADDCVAIEGEGSKTTLARAESRLCGGSRGRAPAGAASGAGLGARGAGSPACQAARQETNGWPAGLGRRRALLRELMVCEHPGQAGGAGAATPGGGGPCARAWAEVEQLPFGPERAAARERARQACRP